jgi:hypothetical protein
MSTVRTMSRRSSTRAVVVTEHRGHSGQPGTGSPNVNQREHLAWLDASGS